MAGHNGTSGAGTALITGASRGIGLELARVFAAHGHDLVLVARSEAELSRVAVELAARHRVRVRPVALDLGAPDAPPALMDRLRDDGIRVEVLVNNAGFGVYGPFAGTDLRAELDLLQLNVVALTHLTKLALPDMLRGRSGRILNVASTAAFLPGPLMAVYYASKAYVLSFSEAIAEELRGSGVTVTALCPGPTRSDFTARANMADSKLFRGGVMDPAEVAEAAYDGVIRGQPVVIPGTANGLLPFAVRLLPRRAAARLARKVQERAT